MQHILAVPNVVKGGLSSVNRDAGQITCVAAGVFYRGIIDPKETKQPPYSLDIRECLNNFAIKYLEGSRSHACLNNPAIKHPASYAGYLFVN